MLYTLLGIWCLGATNWVFLSAAAVLLAAAAAILNHTNQVPFPWWGYPLTALGLAAFTLTIGRWLVLWSWKLHGWLVGYFDDKTTQLVFPDREGRWVLTDHATKHPGNNEADKFRKAVFTHLAAQADLHWVVIYTETYVPKLAELYARDMPGLQLVGTRRDRFRRAVHMLRRDPMGRRIRH